MFGEPGDGFVLEYLYDVWGNVRSVKHPRWSPWDTLCPTATEVESLYAYDGSWLTGAGLFREDDQTAYAGAGLAYHPSGRPQITAMYADGLEVATQVEVGDASGMPRPGSIYFSADGVPKWSQTDYAYDGSGNVRSFGIWSAGGTSSSRQYTYDGLNRLRALYVGASPERTYSYDPYGNLTALGGTTIVPNPATNRISSVNNVAIPAHPAHGYWDVRGNLRKIPHFPGQREKEFAFSTEDRLMESVDVGYSAMWRYAYDTAGERVISWLTDGLGNTGEARITIRDEGGMPLTDWLWSDPPELPPTFSRSRDYLYAGGRMVAQVDWGAGTPTRRFAAVDHLGSTRYLVGLNDALGVVSEEALEFYPFGQFNPTTPAPDPDTTHLFTGHERDIGLHLSELDYMHARYYSPNLGRFMSVDPIGGDIGSSQSWNRYTYVMNNPIGATDPTGMFSEYQVEQWGGNRPLMQPAQTPEGERMDALFIGFFVSAGGGLATFPYTFSSVSASLLFGGAWNLAGGATSRYLDGDPATGAGDLAAGSADFGLGFLAGGVGYYLNVIKLPGGAITTTAARVGSTLSSNVLPIAAQKVIDQASDALLSSGVLENLSESVRELLILLHRIPKTQSNTLVTSAGPPRMVEYIRSNHG